jgi:hypothetical protein
VTIRLKTICITGEQNCLQRVSGFFSAHDLVPRRTPNRLEFSADDLRRAVEVYERGEQ